MTEPDMKKLIQEAVHRMSPAGWESGHGLINMQIKLLTEKIEELTAQLKEGIVVRTDPWTSR